MPSVFQFYRPPSWRSAIDIALSMCQVNPASPPAHLSRLFRRRVDPLDTPSSGQAKTRVDSFLPVALLVHNPTPWPVEVEVQASSEAEGCGSAHRGGEDEAEGDADAAAGRDSSAHVMWSGMPRFVTQGMVSPML